MTIIKMTEQTMKDDMPEEICAVIISGKLMASTCGIRSPFARWYKIKEKYTRAAEPVSESYIMDKEERAVLSKALRNSVNKIEPVSDDALRRQPPTSNDYVADGCELFPEDEDILKEAVKRLRCWKTKAIKVNTCVFNQGTFNDIETLINHALKGQK